MEVDDDALASMITGYTREAGVRNSGTHDRGGRAGRGQGNCGRDERAGRRHEGFALTRIWASRSSSRMLRSGSTGPGIAVGLAWTPVGGDILFIEATQMEGTGKLILTGQLGDVMKESAQTALSFIAANAKGAGHCGGLPLEVRHPYACPGRGDSEGRSVGRRHHADGAGVAADRKTRAERPGDDRGDHPPRGACCRSAA